MIRDPLDLTQTEVSMSEIVSGAYISITLPKRLKQAFTNCVRVVDIRQAEVGFSQCFDVLLDRILSRCSRLLAIEKVDPSSFRTLFG